MDLAYLILIVLAVIYVPIWVWVWRKPEQAERYHLCKYGPCIMIKTRLGFKTMDRLCKYTRFWRAFGFFSKLVSAVLFLLMMYMLVVAIIAVPSRMASGSSIGIEYALAIPGLNPMLPLVYGVIALVVAMVVHELGHGIQARANGARVDSSGLLYGVVPLGAFVEPNEEDMKKKSRRAQMDMYTAGISVNTVVAILCFALLVGCCGTLSSDYEDDAGVYYMDDGSPAYLAGIPASAIITGVSESSVYDPSDPSTIQSVGTSVVDGSVSLDADVDPLHYYYVQYVYNDETYVTEEPIQMGVYVRSLTSGGPADQAGIENGEFIYSIVIGEDEHTVGSISEFRQVMDATSPGQTVKVGIVQTVAYGSVYDPSAQYVTVTLGDNGGRSLLGVTMSTSGMTFMTPGILLDRAMNPFYGADSAYSYFTSIFSYLSGPFNGMDPISDEVQWWYDAPMGDVMWFIITLLYWLFWLNILLAISNALPAYPFDGGFIFAGGVSWLCEKLGVRDEERRNRITESVSGSVSTVVLFMFMIVVLSFLM